MTQVEVTYCTRPQVATCNKSSISPLHREKPKIYSPFFLFGKPAFCSVVIKRNKPTKERNLETRNILSHRWKSFHARLKRKTTWSRVVAAFYIGFCCAIALVDWKACAYYICHAGIFLHVMNNLIVYLFIFFLHFWLKKSSHNFGKKRAFLRIILIFEISHAHTLTDKNSRTPSIGQWSKGQNLHMKPSNWIEGNAVACEQGLPGAPGELARSQARNAMKAKFSALNKK